MDPREEMREHVSVCEKDANEGMSSEEGREAGMQTKG